MIKAVFFDVDGTLVSFNTHDIAKSTKQALQALRDKGIKVFVATGRPYKGVAFLKGLFDFEFDGYITTNGQYCYSKDGLIYESCIPRESLQMMLPYIQEKQIACHFAEHDYLYINLINDKVRTLYELLGSTETIPPVVDPKRALENKVYQLDLYLDEKDVEEEKEFFEHLPGCKGVRWNPLFMDVITEDGGKAVGIDKMLEHFNIALEETMAFGDGGNDIDMLRHVKIGVAMGNSADKVKQNADYVTDDVDRDGVYNALSHFKMI